MKRSFTDIFIKHPVLAIVVNLIIVLIGVRACFTLPIQQFPTLESSSIAITTVYTGASADTVSGFLTTPIERAVSEISGIDYIESNSTAGVSLITIHLQLNHNSVAALSEVNARLQQVRSQLPAEAEPPTIEISRADRPYASFYLSFTSDQFTIPQLTDYLTRVIQPQLSTLSDIQRVGIEAGQNPAMRIWIDPEKLARKELTSGDVYSALRRNNYLAAIGRVKSDSVQVDLLTNTDLKSVDEFRNLIVYEKDGAVVRLNELADVELGAEEPQRVAMYRGEPAVYVSVWPLPGSNEIGISYNIRDAMEKIRPSLPKHIDMQLAYDATTFMEAALTEISQTLVETILIVGLVVFLFLGSIRTAIVPLVAMPVSLVGATVVMSLMGFSLNLLTILAIVLSVGLVVDDAIVVVENIQRHAHNGMNRISAALLGARELVGPIIAMTITLAAVYAPIGFQGGLTGMLFREFAFTLAAAVLVSGFVAVTLSPVMSAYMIRPSGKEAWLTRQVNHIFDWLQQRYESLLKTAIGVRWAIAFSALMVSVAAVPLYQLSSRELAPTEDQGAIGMMIEAAPDATLKSTTRWSMKLAERMQEIPESNYLWAVIGSNNGFGGVIMKDWHERDRSTQEMIGQVSSIASEVAGVQPLPILVPSLPVAGNFDVELVVKSDLPPEQLAELAQEIKLKASKSGKFLYVDTDLRFDLPQARINIDRNRVADLKLDLAAIAQDLGVFLGGAYVNRFDFFSRSYQVIPQLAEIDRSNPSSLMDIKIRVPSGEQVPVSTFATIVSEVAPRTLQRFQQQGSMRMYAGVFPGVTKDAGLDELESIAREVMGLKAAFDYAGESRQIRKEGNALIVTLAFALALIYLVLAAQFQSFRDPLIILFGSVPLAITGALTLTFLDLTTINIYSQVGLITLVGLVAKNGILIVEFANVLRHETSLDKSSAVIAAAKTRLRPILMTSFATMLGHFPLVLVTGPGAQARNSIGIVLVAGMGIGTVFTLFVVPALYTIISAKEKLVTDEASLDEAKDDITTELAIA